MGVTPLPATVAPRSTEALRTDKECYCMVDLRFRGLEDLTSGDAAFVLGMPKGR